MLIALARSAEIRMLPTLQERCERAVRDLLDQSEPAIGLYALVEAMQADQV